MRTLKEYIDKLKKIRFERSYQVECNRFDLYDLQILDCCINYYRENYDEHYEFNQIFESHSIFNKCREITKFLTFVLVNFDVKESSILFMCNDIDEIKNDYVTSININYESNVEDNAQYDQTLEKSIIDNKLDFIVINVNANLDKDKIYDKIEHELTHSFDDYNRIINSAESLNDKTIKSKYHKLTINDKDSEELKKVKSLLYLLDRSEQNAYIAQFDGILGDNKYLTIQQAYDKIYSSKLYKDIKSFSYLVTHKDKQTQDLLCDLYRKIYENPKISDNKILKKIYKEWDRFFEHFRRNIYQCICDHIKDQSNVLDRAHSLSSSNNDNDNLKQKIENNYLNKSIFIEK